jgi:hypothetical protein
LAALTKKESTTKANDAQFASFPASPAALMPSADILGGGRNATRDTRTLLATARKRSADQQILFIAVKNLLTRVTLVAKDMRLGSSSLDEYIHHSIGAFNPWPMPTRCSARMSRGQRSSRLRPYHWAQADGGRVQRGRRTSDYSRRLP